MNDSEHSTSATINTLVNDQSEDRKGAPHEAREMEPFPLDALPPQVEAMVREVARVSFAHLNLVAVQSLPWMAAALGKGAVGELGSQKTFANVFVLGVAGTGSGKSESARHLQKPFEALMAREKEEWRTNELPKVKARLMEINFIIDSTTKSKSARYGFSDDDSEMLAKLLGEKADLESRMQPPRLSVEDFTQEAIAETLLSFDESLICFSSDAGKVISNLLGRYAQKSEGGKLREDTTFLKGFSVEPFQIDRVKRSYLLTEPCISTLWLIQPGKLGLLFDDEGLCDGGFMPRVMPCLVPEGLPQRSFQPPIREDVLRGWESVIENLFVIRQTGGCVNSKCRVTFEISREAADRVMEWDNTHRARTTAELKDVSAFVSRWGEWAYRIAVLLQSLKFQADLSNIIALETMNKAIRIADWFINEQLRILQEGRMAAYKKKAGRLNSRQKQLRGVLKSNGNERSLADLGRRNGFQASEVEEIVHQFPQIFRIETRATSTKPAKVCVLV
jgi:hypothetical protein